MERKRNRLPKSFARRIIKVWFGGVLVPLLIVEAMMLAHTYQINKETVRQGVENDLSQVSEDLTALMNNMNSVSWLLQVEGKDVIIIDDMISSGESMLDVAKQLKDRKAGRVFVCTTFGLFTDGLEKFDEYYEKGYISKVVTTNLHYRRPELLTRPYYEEADMSKFLASIIDSMNHDVSINHVQSPTEKIHKLLASYQPVK